MKHMMKLHHHSKWALAFMRLSVGIIFLVHGTQKWALWSAVPADMPANIEYLMKFLSIVEPLGGLALIIGFLTQWAAAGLSLIMVGAILFKMNVLNIGFIGNNATGWEFDLALLAANLVLLFVGPGSLSFDHMCCGDKKGDCCDGGDCKC